MLVVGGILSGEYSGDCILFLLWNIWKLFSHGGVLLPKDESCDLQLGEVGQEEVWEEEVWEGEVGKADVFFLFFLGDPGDFRFVGSVDSVSLKAGSEGSIKSLDNLFPAMAWVSKCWYRSCTTTALKCILPFGTPSSIHWTEVETLPSFLSFAPPK